MSAFPKARNLDLFAAGAARMDMDEAIALTRQSLRAYGPAHDHWCIAWSGGKDSTATLTMLLWMLDTGMVEWPKTLRVYYADTRQELPPLAIAAERIIEKLRTRGLPVLRVMAPMDKRFLVYILGRGVPPPNNNTLRWCTRQIKIDPMQDALRDALADIPGEALMLTGVRQGESAIRDRRIEVSCSKDGAECGQGWYQLVVPEAAGIKGRLATLAPLLHWRVCHIWDWLRHWAPASEFGGWDTAILADAYGGDEAEEINARTGCIGCPLAQDDPALRAVIAMPGWGHLAPLLELKPMYRWLREPAQRLRKAGAERTKSGALAANPQRMGPLTFATRTEALARVLDIQGRVNASAPAGRSIDILNPEETARIRELIAAETWPRGWSGDEPLGDAVLPVTVTRLGEEIRDMFAS
jgi:DNA sulfur modification protein DndC